jgi:prophage antirepressor-like protein
MTELQVFNNGGAELRTVMIDGQPWFVAADVCGSLGIANSRDAVSRLDEDERGVALTDTPSGEQKMGIVNESGLWALVMTSRKPEARAFKKWLTSEVIPALRKTGSYAIEQPKQMSQLEIVLASAQALLEQSRHLAQLQAEVSDIKHRTASTQGEFFTIMGYASLMRRKIDAKAAAALGKKATAESKAQGIPIENMPDPRYGRVNTYHREILEAIF